PGVGPAGQLLDAAAGSRRHRQGQAQLAHLQLVVAGQVRGRQAALAAEAAAEHLAVLAGQLVGGPVRLLRQHQAAAKLQGQQRRMGGLALGVAQGGEAGLDLLRALRRVAEGLQQAPLGLRADPLGAAVGVHPVDHQPGSAGQFCEQGVAHGATSSVARALRAGSTPWRYSSSLTRWAQSSSAAGERAPVSMALSPRLRSMRSSWPLPRRQLAARAAGESTSTPSEWAPGMPGTTWAWRRRNRPR